MRLTPRAALLLLLLTAAVWFVYLTVYRVDDAFIVFRYAENLASGNGLVFNPGERVEGVSCFLWTVILAPFAAVGLPLPVVAPLLTASCGLLLLALFPAVSARLAGRESPHLWDVAGAALFALHPAFAYWSVGALETTPYALLLFLALRAQLSESGQDDWRRSAIFMGLAVLTRPEAPLMAGAFLCERVLRPRQDGAGGRWRSVGAWALTVAAFAIGLIAFRLAYFGEFLPNTYHAKMGGSALARALVGLGYTRDFLASLAPGFGSYAPWAAWLGGAGTVGLAGFGLRRATLRLPAFVVLALALAVMIEGGDWMALHRFWVPALPCLALLGTAALKALAARGTPGSLSAAAFVALLVVSDVAYGIQERDGARGLKVNAEGYRHAHYEIARYLKAHARPGDTVALMDVGIIGYESGLAVFDISGLVTREVAMSPGGFLDKDYPVEALLERDPRFFVLVPGFPIDTRILLSAAFHSRYKLVLERNHRFNWEPPDEYVLSLFERRRGEDPRSGERIEPAQ